MTLSATKWHFVEPELYAFAIPALDNSGFAALINGAPTSTQVPYDNDLHELGLPEEGTMDDCYGRMVLNNVTRGNIRKIEYCDHAANIIHTPASTDNWADNDVIRLLDPTINTAGYFALDLSAEIPTTATAVYYVVTFVDSTSLMYINIHPISSFSDEGKNVRIDLQVLNRAIVFGGFMKCINQKICFMFDNVTDCEILIKILAYTTEVEMPTKEEIRAEMDDNSTKLALLPGMDTDIGDIEAAIDALNCATAAGLSSHDTAVKAKLEQLKVLIDDIQCELK